MIDDFHMYDCVVANNVLIRVGNVWVRREQKNNLHSRSADKIMLTDVRISGLLALGMWAHGYEKSAYNFAVHFSVGGVVVVRT